MCVCTLVDTRHLIHHIVDKYEYEIAAVQGDTLSAQPCYRKYSGTRKDTISIMSPVRCQVEMVLYHSPCVNARAREAQIPTGRRRHTDTKAHTYHSSQPAPEAGRRWRVYEPFGAI